MLGTGWRHFSDIRAGSGELGQSLAQRFVWREAGADAYRALAGNALAPPMWDVRFARFDGDVVERTEEWRVTVIGNGQVRQVRHRLPEGAPGANLARDAALDVARRVVRDQFGLDASQLQLRTAELTKRDARSDWTIVFADPKVFVGKDGEARIQVLLAGDEVASAGRSVFVPEAWQRAETERDNRLQVVKYAGVFATALGALAALIFAVISWNHGHCDKRALFVVGALAMIVAVIDMANSWPEIAMQLSTAEPVASQLATTIAGGLFASVLTAGLMALLAGVGAWYARSTLPTPLATRLPAWAVGVAVALTVAGLAARLRCAGAADRATVARAQAGVAGVAAGRRADRSDRTRGRERRGAVHSLPARSRHARLESPAVDGRAAAGVRFLRGRAGRRR